MSHAVAMSALRRHHEQIHDDAKTRPRVITLPWQFWLIAGIVSASLTALVWFGVI